MKPSNLGNVLLTVALIPLVLWLDAGTTMTSQLGLAALTGTALWWMLKVLTPEDRARVWGCVVISALGETFCTQLWGAYAYRLGNVPAYVIIGHGMLCAMALSGGKQWASHSRVIVILVGIIASTWAVLGLMLPARPDVEGALFLPLFLPLLVRSPRRLEHALTFLAASFVELVGTGVHTWEWNPTLPWLELSAGNPPSVVAGGYCYFAVFGGLLVTMISTRKPTLGQWFKRVMPGLLLVGALATQRQALASSLVRYSSFEEIAPSVFVEPEMPAAQRAQTIELLTAGKARVAGFYGTYSAHPTIIIGSDMRRLAPFASNRYASTHYSPLGAAVVIGPNGQNLDVVSHELAHAELFGRIGWWRMLSQVPTWFDEGLAMQFDERAEYGEEAYAKLPERAELEGLTTARRFFDENAVAHYVQARHDVGERRARLKAMVDELLAGDAITAVWR